MVSSDSFWGITTFFNPSGYRTKLDNYRRFRERSREQGLSLCTVELTFGDAAAQLVPERDADVVVQRSSTAVLWQKERLLNVALEHLPDACEAVCWVDADVLFERDDWVTESARLLADHVMLQPFSAAVRLPRGGSPGDLPGSEVGRSIEKGTGIGTYSASVCSSLHGLLGRFSGTTGYAWCARRAFLDEVGFYDRCIVGGGDREMALAAVFPAGKVPKKHLRIHHPRLREHLREWHERVHPAARGRVAHLPGTLHHLWHGDPKDRGYVDRHAVLDEFDFDPERDITIDDNGCWQWSTDKQGLIDAVAAYFASRKEDG